MRRLATLAPVTAASAHSPSRPGSARSAFARRAATAYALALVPLSLVLAAPASAVERSDGDSPGEPISTLAAIGIFVGAPLGLFLLIALLTFAPGTTRGPRYRPGSGWNADSAYLGGGGSGVHGAAAGDEQTQAKGAGGASGTW